MQHRVRFSPKRRVASHVRAAASARLKERRSRERVRLPASIVCPVCLADLGETIPVPLGATCPGCGSFIAGVVQ